MKKVAGRLRLDLAQFRELEAFTKFGSDLDKATQQQLTRGAHLVELLKQGQYAPMPVEQQVVSIFAGTNGYLDEIPLEHVQRFEREILELMELKYQNILNEIADTKDLSDQLQQNLHAILKDFVASFANASTKLPPWEGMKLGTSKKPSDQSDKPKSDEHKLPRQVVLHILKYHPEILNVEDIPPVITRLTEKIEQGYPSLLSEVRQPVRISHQNEGVIDLVIEQIRSENRILEINKMKTEEMYKKILRIVARGGKFNSWPPKYVAEFGEKFQNLLERNEKRKFEKLLELDKEPEVNQLFEKIHDRYKENNAVRFDPKIVGERWKRSVIKYLESYGFMSKHFQDRPSAERFIKSFQIDQALITKFENGKETNSDLLEIWLYANEKVSVIPTENLKINKAIAYLCGRGYLGGFSNEEIKDFSKYLLGNPDDILNDISLRSNLSEKQAEKIEAVANKYFKSK